MRKVIVGMSGGVDSAVTAYLLKAAGFAVTGITLRTWSGADGQESRCCEISDAMLVAQKLDIPYYAVNCISCFREKVIDPFVEDYVHGLTPNPCVDCNRDVKWEQMLLAAARLRADYIATGHYASLVRLPNGRYTVQQSSFAEKDQTYMLYRLTQEQLSRTIMPLGKLSKKEVRQIAEKTGLPVAHKKDSQEICFVTGGGYADYIEEETDAQLPPEGCFVDVDGNIVGRHRGIIHYTVGQRKDEQSLYSKEILCNAVNFMSVAGIEAGNPLRANVKIRYHHRGEDAWLKMEGEDMLRIIFDEPVRAAAPGQSAVFYDEDRCVIGGGKIVKAE